MTYERSTFLSDSSLNKLVSAKNIEDLTLGMMLMIHTNRGIAEVKARRFFLTSGENRAVLKDYELNDLENIDALMSPEQNTMIRLRTDSDYNILSQYINTGEESAVKSIVIKLMSSGIMHDILPNLNIKRPEILFNINQYYDSKIPQIHSEFSKFMFKYPKLERKLPTQNRSDLYTTQRVSAITSIYKTIPNKAGELPTQEEIKRFENDLGELRAKIKSFYEPASKDLLNLFGLTSATYSRNVARAQNELGQMLINS